MKPKTDIRVRLTGQNGNIFNLLGIALRALRDGGHGELCQPLTDAVTHSKSYEEALCRFAEYVEVE